MSINQKVDRQRLREGENIEQRFIEHCSQQKGFTACKLGSVDGKVPYTYAEGGQQCVSPDVQVTVRGQVIGVEVKKKQLYTHRGSPASVIYDIPRILHLKAWQEATGITAYIVLYISNPAGHPDPDPNGCYIASLDNILGKHIVARPASKDGKYLPSYVYPAHLFTPFYRLAKAVSKENERSYTPVYFSTTADCGDLTRV